MLIKFKLLKFTYFKINTVLRHAFNKHSKNIVVYSFMMVPELHTLRPFEIKITKFTICSLHPNPLQTRLHHIQLQSFFANDFLVYDAVHC